MTLWAFMACYKDSFTFLWLPARKADNLTAVCEPIV
jgi:hypothetical protein